MSKVWFITGASRGFGRQWAEAALGRGDRVAATARDRSTLDALVQKHGDAVLPLELDVTDRAGGFAAVQQAHARFGRLDVLVNNAGYGLIGAVEEVTEEQARAQFETNVFGLLWITQAALPIMRAQGSGRILQISSIGGVVAFSKVGLYNASKFAVEGLGDALAQEVESFGIRLTLVEPGSFETDWAGSSAVHTTEIPAYATVERGRPSPNRGNPEATAAAVLQLADAENPPRRIFLGEPPLALARAAYAERLATWESWQDVSRSAQGS